MTGALAMLCLLPLTAADVSGEFIVVGADRFSFHTAVSRTPFVPLGANFVLGSKEYLNNFGPEVYDADYYTRVLDAAAGIQLNTIKVFLPIAQVLPDPQGPLEAVIAPGYLDNLAHFLGLCRERGIRCIVALTSWGGNGIRWWHDGGQYWGRAPWRTDGGVDSRAVLRSFWMQVAGRFADEPTIFAWTPAVEWTFPASNLTWTRPDEQHGRLLTEQAMFYWRAWLAAKYGDVEALNAAYEADYDDFDAVPVVDYDYDQATRRYASPDAMVQDYQDWREWSSMRYLRPQIEAIRAADPNHLVTISNHMRRPVGLWPGAARYFMGFSVPEQAPLVDFYTHHDNNDEGEQREGFTLEQLGRAATLRMRFCLATERKPILMEEFSFGSVDPERTAAAHRELILGTVGSSSGWLTWYLMYPADANQADTANRCYLLDDDLQPSPAGLLMRELGGPDGLLARTDLAYRPGRTQLALDRTAEMVPRELGTLIRIERDWNGFEHPVDFVWPPNAWINLRLAEE